MPQAPFPPSDHCDGLRFFNVHADTAKSLRDLVRYRFREPRARWPRWIEDARDARPLPAVAPGEAALTFVGHSTFLVRVGGLAILTDPVFSARVGPAGPLARLGPSRVRAPALALEDLPPIDLVLVSHNHYDHLDLPSLKALARRDAPLVAAGLGNGGFLAGEGIGRTVDLDWWQTLDGPKGCRVTFVPAQHWSFRLGVGANATLWGGFVVETAAATVYFAGDSGYCPHFAEIGARFPRIDAALLPIGAFEPRWFMAPQHMGPDEAVRAHLDLGARRSLAMHFGTFQLTPERIDAAAEGLAQARAALGVDPELFHLPAFGETVVLPPGA